MRGIRGVDTLRFSLHNFGRSQVDQTTTVSGPLPAPGERCIVVITMGRRQNPQVGELANCVNKLVPAGYSHLLINIGTDLDEATRVLRGVPNDAHVVLITDAEEDDYEKVRAALPSQNILDNVRGERVQSTDFTNALSGLYAWSQMKTVETVLALAVLGSTASRTSTGNPTRSVGSGNAPPRLPPHNIGASQVDQTHGVTTVSGAPPAPGQPCLVVITMDHRQNSRVGTVANRACRLVPPASSLLMISIGTDLDEATRVLQKRVPADANVVLITDASPDDVNIVREALSTQNVLDHVLAEHVHQTDFLSYAMPALYALQNRETQALVHPNLNRAIQPLKGPFSEFASGYEDSRSMSRTTVSPTSLSGKKFHFTNPFPPASDVPHVVVAGGPGRTAFIPEDLATVAKALSGRVANCHLFVNDGGSPHSTEPVREGILNSLGQSPNDRSLLFLHAHGEKGRGGIFTVNLDGETWLPGSRLFEQIAQVHPAPVEIFMTCCRGKSALRDAHLLPKGSVVVTLSPNDQATLGADIVRLRDRMQGVCSVSAFGLLVTYCATAMENRVPPTLRLQNGFVVSLDHQLSLIQKSDFSAEDRAILHEQLDSLVDPARSDDVIAKIESGALFPAADYGLAMAISAISIGVRTLHTGDPASPMPATVAMPVVASEARRRLEGQEFQDIQFSDDVSGTYFRHIGATFKIKSLNQNVKVECEWTEKGMVTSIRQGDVLSGYTPPTMEALAKLREAGVLQATE